MGDTVGIRACMLVSFYDDTHCGEQGLELFPASGDAVERRAEIIQIALNLCRRIPLRVDAHEEHAWSVNSSVNQLGLDIS